MPVGGSTGKPPVRTAFQSSRSQITSVLQRQMSTVLERANKDMARRARTG
jgi:phenylacetate-coenzyme A ligase PaaK-like adenylate-forming protein